MGIVSPAVGKAMVKQLNRTRRQSPSDVICDLNVALTKAERERDEALEREQALKYENDSLRQRLKREQPAATGAGYLQINGIDVVNQVDAARILNEPQYKISRWLKAGKLEKVVDPNRKCPWIAVRSLKKPERGQPGRPKKSK